VRALLVAVLASLALAAPASAAFTPPELFVRLQRADITHQPASDWIPLASAPVFNYIGGYQIGYRLQASGMGSGPGNFQTAALTITGVPDGQVTQPNLVPPYCVGKNGTAGTIVPVNEIEMQYEGNGTYSVSVSVGGDPPGIGCFGAGGATSTGSFTVDTHVAPQLVGQPFAFRAKPLPGDPFVGIRADDPPGGFADNLCALDATVAPDGSVTGRKIAPEDFEPPRQTVRAFPEPGAWTCVSRGVVEGQDDAFERTFLGTPWSAPVRFDVLSDFQRKTSAIVRPRRTRPTFEVTAQFAAASAGGKATLKLRRFVRCKRRAGYVFKKLATYKGTFDAKGLAKFRFKRPRKTGFYAAMVTFGGTRFVRPGADPFLIPLGATGRSIRFVPPQAYPRC
jgi:hypothetical protein